MRNPDKGRFLNAVRHVEQADIPLFECDPDISMVNKLLESEFPLSMHSYDLPIPDYVELNRRMGNDMIYFAHIWRLGRKERTDEHGRIHYIDGLMKTPECLKDINFPDLDRLERRLEELCRACERTGFGIVCATQPAPFVVATAMGIQDYWLATLDQPGFVHEFTKTVHDWCLREQQRFMRYPIDVVKVGCAFVNNTGPMCSPAMLEEFETAYRRQQIDMAKAKGLPVYLHIDGNLATLMDDLIAMGVDIVNPIEPCAGQQDIYALKKLYGNRVTLCGNIDINGVLLHGTTDEVRHDVTEHIDRLGAGGGYIVSSSHDIHQLIPVENFCAMRDAVLEHRFKARGR